MSDSEVITILVLFHLGAFRTVRHFYIHDVQKHLQEDFLQTVSYNRFIELTKKVCLPMTLFLKTCCLGECTGISFVDSTPLRVYKNKRIKRNRVFKGPAATGKSTMERFYGRANAFQPTAMSASTRYSILPFFILISLLACMISRSWSC
jgi:hypothetical protein